MKCPWCNGDIEIMVGVTIRIPGEMDGKITKINLRSKYVKLIAANWPKASFFCKNNNCGWSNIQKRNKGKESCQQRPKHPV